MVVGMGETVSVLMYVYLTMGQLSKILIPTESASGSHLLSLSPTFSLLDTLQSKCGGHTPTVMCVQITRACCQFAGPCSPKLEGGVLE